MENPSSKTVQITSTFVADPILGPLRFLTEKLGIDADIRFSDFNQVFQQLLDPTSESSRNRSGFNLFLIRLEDLSENAITEAIVEELESAFLQFSKAADATNLVLFCPKENCVDEASRLEEMAVQKLGSIPSVTVLASSELENLYPVADPFDPKAERVGKIPFTETMFAALATAASRKMSLHLRPPGKVLVLDADNTLWSGVAGEDGPEGLKMDGPWAALQTFAKEKQEEGFLLALCSKNNESDLERVFSERAEDLVLNRESFAGWKVNWNPKSQSIRELASELNLGVDSFVFLDDNPAEIAEVSANCPGVTAICLPENPDEFPRFLKHLWCLDRTGRTNEDRLRTEFYQKESQRKELLDSSRSFEDFLKGLDLEINIRDVNPEDLLRVSQLTQRTNQFNANPLRLSETELAAKIDAGEKGWTVSVADRFGDYGLVGTVLFSESDSTLTADLFLLSCRALGKGVARRMMITLGERALEKKLDLIAIQFQQTERNEPCRRFLEEIGAQLENESECFAIPAKDAAALSPFPTPTNKSLEKTEKLDSAKSQLSSPWNNGLASKIAGEWSDPARLQEILSSGKRPRPEVTQAFVKPGNPVQKKIAAIWRETLGLEEVGIEDSFTELGGGSVQLVRVHTRLQEEFQVSIELPELFTLPTIADIEKRINGGRENKSDISVRDRPVREDSRADRDIAIVGMALKVPGASDPDQFWENLRTGKESISRFERHELAFPEEFDRPDFVPVKGIIEDIDKFDAAFFGILPKDAKIMDPQQRIFLELAWEAMERAGYQPDNHSERIGVYAGAYFDSYLLANLCTDQEFLSDLIPQIQVGSLQTELGNDKDYLATRVAFKLNLRGPAMTLQTACSTSAVAIAEACRSIRDGVCDMALAGGVTVTLPYKRGYFYTEQGMLSGDGHCRAFDEKASGTVFANGAGVVMLKRLSDAVRDRDHIHAVIRGTGINNDGGVKHSYTAPSVDGQVGVIHMAHEDAGIDPCTIGAIEAHGTGTPLGDPIEVTALTKAFREAGVSKNQFCSIGSLKTNVGHLDVASGVCGVIKATLSLEKEELPPLLHFEKPNPKIDFADSPFYPGAKLQEWKTKEGDEPRRAGVSSFGVGGTNVHIVLEEAPAIESEPSARDAQLFLLSARTEAALEKAAENLAGFAETAPANADPADVAWTLAIGRKPFRHRRAVVATGFEDLREQLSKRAAPGIADQSNPAVNFMFPGQGSQHINMARSLYESEPRFRQLIDHCSEILQPHLGLQLTDVLFSENESDVEANSEILKNTTLAQPAIFVIEYAMADLWKHWGVEPSVMIGHSVGEFVAACHAGVFSLEDGLRLLADRGRLMGELPGGGMLSVRLPEDKVLERLPDTLDLAAINSPELCVVAGPHDELQKFCEALTADTIVAKLLHTSHAFHSRMMEPVVDQFAACFESISLHAPDNPIFSTVTGDWLTEKETCDPRYWAKHLREPVRFSQAVIHLAGSEESQIFLEVGPGQTLGGLALQSIDRAAGHTILATCKHVKENGADHAKMLQSLGRLWSKGVEIDWKAFYGEEIRKRVPLPTYPFERKRHWVEPGPQTTIQQGMAVDSTLLPPPTENLSDTETHQLEPDMSTMDAPRNTAIAAEIREILSNLSGIPGEELIGDATFLELGFDSLLLTQVSKAFQDGFGVTVKMRQLMTDYSSIDAMVEYLDATLDRERFREAAAVSPTPVTSAPATAPSAASVATPAMTAPPNSSPLPVNDGTIQSVIAQQMALMQQQLNLLQGGGVVPNTETQQAPAPVTVSPAKKETPKADPSAAKNVSAPTTRIDRDLDDALTDQQRKHVEDLVARYTVKTKTSKELTAEYRQWYADPRTVSNFNRLWKEMIYQIIVKKSKGSRLLDIDGNEYIDLLNGFGPGFLGHSPDRITKVLHEQLDRGVEVGPQNLTAMEASKLFCELTGNERASFVNTGSEAVQAAMRLSRTVTGRDKIVVFEKDYHGNFDEMLVRGVGSGDKVRTMPSAPGIPLRAVDDVIVLPYGTEESLEIIRKRSHELAAVIVEPIQSRRPEFQPKEFIQELRTITREAGTAFVFDEVITGFRTGPRGAQEYFGVEADIATYGKVVGAGMPVGVVAGKAEFMDTFDGGHWQYGDDSFPEKDVTFFAGTFVRHPLAMAAVKEMLLHLKECGPQLWVDLKAKADRLAGTVNQMFIDNEVPFRMPNFGSQMFVRHIDDNKYANLLFFHMREKGVFLLEGFPSYMTTAHTDEDVDYAIAAFRESVAEMQKAGFFPAPSHSVSDSLNGNRLSGPGRQLTFEAGELEGIEEIRTGLEKKKPEPGDATYPLTEPLAEVWLASQVSDDASLCFNEVVNLRLTGDLDESALARSIQDLVNRHEALRATFLPDGEGFRIQPKLEIGMPVVDLTGKSEADREAAFKDLLDEERATPFDLVNGPLFKAKLVKLTEESCSVILNAHHLVCDGWSYNVVTSDLSDLYNSRVKGEEPNLPPAPKFGTYVVESIREEERRKGGESEQYWLKRFADPVPDLLLPRDGKSSKSESDHRSRLISERVDAESTRTLKQIAGKSGATPFAILLGAFQILLTKISREKRVVTLFPTAGQNTGDGNENLVGHCVNFLPLIGEVDKEQSFADLLNKTQGDILDDLEHQDFTFGRLIQLLPVNERPQVEAVFNLERMDGFDEFSGLQSEIEEVSRQFSMNPLFLNVVECGGELEVQLTFLSGLFREETVRQWLDSYVAMLKKIIVAPESRVAEIGSVVSADQLALLSKWNDTRTDYPREKSVGELFDEVAAEHGDVIAIKSDRGNPTYSELKNLVDRIADSLSKSGVGEGDRVALFLEQSPERIASVMAALKIGAIYVPLDPEYPAERLKLMLADSEPAIVVTQKSLRDRLPGDVAGLIEIGDAVSKGKAAGAPETVKGDPNRAAYIIYTSGSTGVPKGTVVPHSGIVRLVRDTDYCEFGPEETILQAASVCFDASTFEIFGALLNGGSLALPPAGHLTLESLSNCLENHQVTTLWLTAGLFQLMVEENLDAFAGVRQLLTGGDVVPVNHSSKLLKAFPGIRLINGYGPTENTTFTTTHRITPEDLKGDSIPIGKPIANTTVWILDESGNPAAPGIAGELCCGGDGLALEYWKNPELTAEKFILAKIGGGKEERFYRTGDLCRFRSDGVIEFLGRIDQQIKIRGFRVEPGEIESQLVRHPKVGQCKVAVVGEGAGEKTLVAFVSPRNGVSPEPEELLSSLQEKLPSYMIPSVCTVVKEFPVNANGKIDMSSLPLPDLAVAIAPADRGDLARLATDLENEIIAIWQDVLPAKKISLDDDFFALGGHSLLGMKLFARIQREMDVSLPLSVLFHAPTVRKLAAEVESRLEKSEGNATGYASFVEEKGAISETTVLIQKEGDLPPLFGVHGGDGGVFFYRDLADRLEKNRPFYAFEAAVLTDGGPIKEETVEETASRYLQEMLKVQAAGPYHLCGYSFGGLVAYEMACQLANGGEEVRFLGLVDTDNPAVDEKKFSLAERVAANWKNSSPEDASVVEKAAKLGKRVGTGLGYAIRFRAEDAVAKTLPTAKNMGWLRQVQVRNAYEQAMKNYVPGQFSGHLTLFRAMAGQDKYDLPRDYHWGSVVIGDVHVTDVPGDHISIFKKENIEGIAAAMRESLSNCEAKSEKG